MLRHTDCRVDLADVRLGRLLEGRDDVAVQGREEGTDHGYLYRPGEILVSEDHAEIVDSVLKQLRVPVCHMARTEFGVVHLKVVTRSDVDTLLHRIQRAAGGKRLAVSPNHVLGGCPGWSYYPDGEPFPDAPPDPCEGDDEVWDGPLVAVVDTGLAANYASLELLDEGVVPADPGQYENPDENGDGLLDVDAGHGTFVAGVVRLRAPGAPLLEGPTLDSDGLVDELSLAQALDELLALQPGPDIINLSLGGYTRDDEPLLALRSLAERRECPLMVAAAGNDALCRPFWPAAFSWVVGVGAVETTDGAVARAEFSNYGPWVDACAAGVDIVSTFQTGTYRSLVDGTLRVFNGGARWSGTSFATPRVSGAVADLAHRDGLSARDAWSAIRAAADDGPPGLGVLVD